MSTHADGAAAGFVLDGFPRTVAQAEALEQMVPGRGCDTAHGSSRISAVTQSQPLGAVDSVIRIDMHPDILVPKVLGRRVCSRCGISYNVADVDTMLHLDIGDGQGARNVRVRMPPVMPAGAVGEQCGCGRGGRLERRDDDTVGVVRARLERYHEETAPVVEFYRRRGLVHDIIIVGGYDVMTPIFERALHLDPDPA